MARVASDSAVGEWQRGCGFVSFTSLNVSQNIVRDRSIDVTRGRNIPMRGMTCETDAGVVGAEIGLTAANPVQWSFRGVFVTDHACLFDDSACLIELFVWIEPTKLLHGMAAIAELHPPIGFEFANHRGIDHRVRCRPVAMTANIMARKAPNAAVYQRPTVRNLHAGDRGRSPNRMCF